MIALDDFVMLGKTIPEPQSDGRIFVCSAGVSPQLGQLLRVYPLSRYGSPKRWSVNQVRLERNPRDARPESWKRATDARGTEADTNDDFVTVRREYPRAGRPSLLNRYAVGSIKEANARRLSLAVLHPGQMELFFEHNPDSPNSPQLALFDDGKPNPKGAKRFAYIPRLRFVDEDGEHKPMLRDWGCFEWMRKEGDSRRFDLVSNLHLTPSSSLLVGNFNRHRTSWLVISVLNGLRQADALFDVADAA